MKIYFKKSVAFLFLGTALSLASCVKKDDPFVDRVVAPVLLVFDNAVGDGGGFTYEPTVRSSAAASNVTISVRVLELDKTNILDFKKGIDSIPVRTTLTLFTRAGAKIADFSTDDKGRATLTRPWADFGLATPRVGNTVSLTLSGKHKDQVFSKLARLQAN
ncbi:MAG: hypothetical protein ACK4GN_09935 [Runella sp.]